MLGFLVRGAFFLGVVGWYSFSLWGMIDGYFKEQFKRYLEKEFERNPAMRGDMIRSPASVGKADSVAEECTGGFCSPAGAADAFPAGALAGGEGPAPEKEVAGPAFHGSPDDRPPGEPPRSKDVITDNQDSSTIEIVTNKETAPEYVLESRLKENEKPSEKQSIYQQKESEQLHQKSEFRKRSKSWLRSRNTPPNEYFTNRKARGDSILVLPRVKLEESKRHRLKRNFFESDRVDEDKEENVPGIPISMLPYKPRIEIYDLEWLPEDEFCPLTLEEDPNCEENRPWSYGNTDGISLNQD